MDIYRFINSKDIAAYLQTIDYRLSTYEMAYLVYHSTNTTIQDKLEAWQWILDNMPDSEEVPTCDWRDGIVSVNSVHDLIARTITLTQQMKRDFMDADGCWYSIEYSMSKHTRYIDKVFDGFSNCMDYLREEILAEDEELAEGKTSDQFLPVSQRFTVIKHKIGGDRLATAIFDRDLNMLDLSAEHYANANDVDIDLLFDNGHVRLPVPFQKGDIVIDTTDIFAKPFVFDSLKFWNSQDMKEHGVEVDETSDRWQKNDARIQKYNEQHIWDCSHMVAMGYALSYDQLVGDDANMLWYDDFGAANSYLDVEYYRKPLKDEQRTLKLISEFATDHLDIEAFVNLMRYIRADSHTKRLRDFIETQYNDFGRSFLADEYPCEVNAKS